MANTLSVDICVIGAGSGGLSVAAGASQLGAATVLIEKGAMGGDCLNFGCVPSKALLSAGRAAAAVTEARRFGIRADAPAIDGAAVYAHVRGTIAAIAPNDSVERFEGLGVTVIRAAARFTGPDTLEAGDARVRARRFVIATGSHAAVPPIPGLDSVPFLTNETIFGLGAIPGRLIVIGGGPIGIEMAQAHRDLGAEVTVLEAATILPKDDPELVDIVRTRLLDGGVDLREGVTVARVEPGPRVVLGDGRTVEGTHLLLATGRRPSIEGLGLDVAGVAHTRVGITVDARLRTTNRRIFAVGDVRGGYQFTHMAGYDAGIVIRNALFRLPAKADTRAVPWVTYTRPELAQVGLTEARARETHGAIRVLRSAFAENDRAQAEADIDGLIKVIATPRGRILGAGIVGTGAGDLLAPWILAIGRGMKIGAMAGMIAPYPTRSEIGKRAAGSFFTPGLFSERTRRIVRFLARFG